MARTFRSDPSVDSNFPYVSYVSLVPYVPITRNHIYHTSPPCDCVILLFCDYHFPSTSPKFLRKQTLYLCIICAYYSKRMNMTSTRYKRQTATINPQPNIHSKQKGADRNGLHLLLYHLICPLHPISLEPTQDLTDSLNLREALEGSICIENNHARHLFTLAVWGGENRRKIIFVEIFRLRYLHILRRVEG